ncbi:hypothetical protein [Streptomyces sp. P9-A2]|uniref:hypothetical protein n=1 Tax=Streptomyces sp. P9-A2 TaxID=3072284 RepID=UPI002FCBDD8E
MTTFDRLPARGRCPRVPWTSWSWPSSGSSRLGRGGEESGYRQADRFTRPLPAVSPAPVLTRRRPVPSAVVTGETVGSLGSRPSLLLLAGYTAALLLIAAGTFRGRGA